MDAISVAYWSVMHKHLIRLKSRLSEFSGNDILFSRIYIFLFGINRQRASQGNFNVNRGQKKRHYCSTSKDGEGKTVEGGEGSESSLFDFH